VIDFGRWVDGGSLVICGLEDVVVGWELDVRQVGERPFLYLLAAPYDVPVATTLNTVVPFS
jgi:hypothetical protein